MSPFDPMTLVRLGLTGSSLEVTHQDHLGGGVDGHQGIDPFSDTRRRRPRRDRSFLTARAGRPVVHKYVYGIAIHDTFTYRISRVKKDSLDPPGSCTKRGAL